MRSLFDHFEVDDAQAITLRISVHTHLLIKVREAKRKPKGCENPWSRWKPRVAPGLHPWARARSESRHR